MLYLQQQVHEIADELQALRDSGELAADAEVRMSPDIHRAYRRLAEEVCRKQTFLRAEDVASTLDVCRPREDPQGMPLQLCGVDVERDGCLPSGTIRWQSGEEWGEVRLG
ncbi:MAG: hypothetical protein ACE5F1_00970 [Planctomycetota bacterium]